MQAQCELKAAGLSYPRTCPVCKLGPCQRDPRAAIFANSSVTFEGRRNGMNEPDPRGEYVGLSVQQDRGGAALRVKISVSQAETLGRDLLRNT